MNKRFIIILLCLIFALISGIIIHKNQNRTVNIVFTTDANYKDYLKTTIKSAIANKNKNSIYKINILCVDLDKKDRDAYKKYETENVTINPIPLTLETIKNVGDFPVDYKIVTRADLFKFFMPEIFPELDKILYIDVDTVIMKDLTKLYNTNLNNKYIGAVLKCSDFGIKEAIMHHFNRSKYQEYNCGVILYNLKKWRQDGITAQLIEAKNHDVFKVLMTQDSFNKVIGLTKIKKLSPLYNTSVQINDMTMKRSNYHILYFPHCLLYRNADSIFKHAVIIHYVGGNKPWFNPESQHAHLWLQYSDVNYAEKKHHEVN